MISRPCVGTKYIISGRLCFQVPHDFEFSLYELDWIVFSRHMRGAVNLIPVFETAGIKGTVCGPESFTPDHKPLLGQYKSGLGTHLNTGDVAQDRPEFFVRFCICEITHYNTGQGRAG
jgi:glycine/D-amino acid oxidase-like deaminating enzyme